MGAPVAATWPPEFLDEPALEFTARRLASHPDEREWWLWFVLLRKEGGAREVIGSAGYKGPPTEDGTVEIGYGIASEHHRRGYASEAAEALVSRAFQLPAVRRVIAETLPELAGSIGVLRRTGFTFIGDGSEPGVIRFERLRIA